MYVRPAHRPTVSRSDRYMSFDCGSTAYLSSYLRNKQILIHTRRYDQQIVLPVPCVQLVPVQQNYRSWRIVTITRPVRNTNNYLGFDRRYISRSVTRLYKLHIQMGSCE